MLLRAARRKPKGRNESFSPFHKSAAAGKCRGQAFCPEELAMEASGGMAGEGKV